MKRFATLRSRLLLSHLAVVFATLVTVLIAARIVAPTFYRSHVGTMADMMGGMTGLMESELEAGFEEAFGQALAVSAAIGILVAVAVSVVGARRVIKPIAAVRQATGRLAQGHYTERVDQPAEEELAALANDVNHLAAALEDTESRRLRLLSEVSHELRTPLTTIEGYMEAALDGVLEPTPELIGSVAREAGRLKRLAADIALLSRAEESALRLELTTVDLAVLARSVVDRLRPQFVDADVDLYFDGGGPVLANADADRMTQVITNLVGNALTYTPAGGEVRVTVRRNGNVAQITVTDTGRGVGSDEMERIFERFYRGDRTSPGGMGVGLSIARSLARLHRGDVRVESEGPGKGSTFTIEVPVAR